MLRSLFSIWVDGMIAANAAALTISVRTFRMQRAFLAGDFTGGAEAHRMVIEKIVAAQKGAIAAGVALAAIAITPPRTVRSAQARVRGAAAASLGPGYRKARSNARRLTRYR